MQKDNINIDQKRYWNSKGSKVWIDYDNAINEQFKNILNLSIGNIKIKDNNIDFEVINKIKKEIVSLSRLKRYNRK